MYKSSVVDEAKGDSIDVGHRLSLTYAYTICSYRTCIIWVIYRLLLFENPGPEEPSHTGCERHKKAKAGYYGGIKSTFFYSYD